MTLEAVARRANVSRSWLYIQPGIRAEVERLRDLGRQTPETSVPARQRTTDTSLLRQLEPPTRATENSPRTTSDCAANSHTLSANNEPPQHHITAG